MRNHRAFHNWRRAAVLAFILLAGESILPRSATAQTVTKEALLRNMVKDVIAPGYQELALKCHALTESLEGFVKTSNSESLEKARQAWGAALLASRRIQWLQTGPIADREYLSSFYYSKVLAIRIEGVLKSSRAIDDSYLGELGATAKGMFALEYLLFDRKAQPPGEGNQPAATVLASFSGAEAARRGQYVLALARDLETKAAHLAADWAATGEPSAPAKFIAGGQESLIRVINQLAQFIEQIAEQRINFVLQLPQPIAPQLNRIEGSASGTSQQSVLELLRGAQKLYRGANGGGLELYVKNLNGPLAERLKGQFESAIAAAESIGAPLEQVVPEKPASVQNAQDKTRALEVLCKTDLASVLGVTLTFSSNDGD